MKIIFAGTPEFAAEALRALIEAGHEIVAVLTQPDRPAGRGIARRTAPLPVPGAGRAADLGRRRCGAGAYNN